jgi:3',5'-cyclic-AMP phosphodiesterase
MKHLAWITDVHFNFVDQVRIDAFCAVLADPAPEGVLLSGDTGEAHNVALYLDALAARLDCPVYFVLGNHDFYRGTIAGVRKKIETLCATVPQLIWLPRAGVRALTPDTGLIGHDGWADGRLGDYWGSDVFLNDYVLIGEFLGLDPRERLETLHALGDEAAAHFRSVLPEALARFRHVLVLTHVPPFREACWHEGRISDDNWLPHFSCKAVGEVLAEVMSAHPDRQMTVLCGHTHGAGAAQILPNLRVLTGGAVYGNPQLQQILTVE